MILLIGGEENMVKYTTGPKAKGKKPKGTLREASPDDPIYKRGFVIGGHITKNSSKDIPVNNSEEPKKN
jgi:hypothetical protein